MGKRMINYSVFMKANPLDPSLPEKAFARNQGLHLAYFTDEERWVDVGQLCASVFTTR